VIILLKSNVDRVEINEEEALNLQFREKARLIKTDPVTCARYFDYRYREVLKLLKRPGGIFGSNFITTYYWRVEIKQRGSHSCSRYVLSEVDFNNEEYMSSVIAFIGQFVTVDVTNTDLAPYVKYQKHKHGHSCLKKVRGQSVCRFGIPYPPMPQTEILKPLPEETQNFSLHHENFKKIRSFLLRDQSDELISHLSIFVNFVSHDQVSLSYEDYIYDIRSSLKKPQKKKIEHLQKFKSMLIINTFFLCKGKIWICR